ncbi:MAG: peroxidase [Methylobacter sp.]|nr:MAG: peroxidase [Methylobacter sp.]
MNNLKFDDSQIRDTQGLMFSGYGAMQYCRYYLLRIDDASKVKAWLATVAGERITAGEPDKAARAATESSLNIAFSATGLAKLALNQHDLESFELAFQEGMTSKRRITILGDEAANHPDNWHWGNAQKPVDLLLMLYAKEELTFKQRQQDEESHFVSAGLSIVEQLMDTTTHKQGDFNLEHFGFADGVSEPSVDGFPKTRNQPAASAQAPKTIATGEFVLGYPNAYDGKLTTVPHWGNLADKFGINGTYLVFRQLQQDVKGFWTFIHEEAKRQQVDADYLAAKMVGRWKNGAVVEPGQTAAPKMVSNDFDFTDDPDGTGCPFGSHIRRTNPRGQGLGATVDASLIVANRHRLLRRGRSYGPFLENPLADADAQESERGLFFICLNANIERQFEFVQHTWVNSNKFNGLYDEDDPILGNAAGGNRNFTIQDTPLRRRLCNFQQFVTVRGGGYFFLPGLRALKALAAE